MATSMKELFEIVDRMDPGAFAERFTEDGRFRFGNAPTVTTRAGIADSVEQFFSSLSSLRHDIQDVWEQDDVVITEVEATYVRTDGHEVSLPAVTVARTDGDLIRDYRIYMDINPLFESPA
ncbi:MAG: nuclear transport factor 2 family protein [Actinomycetota bacterium]|nr:nuclear transport factor 2 family protein [Actinomycetota bacterium]